MMKKYYTIITVIVLFVLTRAPILAQTDPQIIGYEYGFNNGQDIQYVSITPIQNLDLNIDIDVNHLTQALNIFHIRFKDDTGKWSSMKSHLFMTHFADVPVDKQIVGYEYAFNNGDQLQYIPVPPNSDLNLLTNIDVSSLTNALNVFHIRFKDNTGKWSSMKSYLFMTHFADVQVDRQIVGYEYAFNNGDQLQYVPVTPGSDLNLLTDIDVSSLTNALNVFHIRFKDDTGKWSSMKSHLFMTHFADVPVDKQIVGYEYAFNNGEQLQYVSISPTSDFNLITDIDVSQLTNPINTLHIRFKDDTGKWSSMKSHLFMKPYLGEETPDNHIVAYYYWFDDDVQNKQVVAINPVNPLVLNELNMTDIWEGEHVLHTQYKDVYGKYSLVTTDTLQKNPFPVAAFTTDETHICEGQSVAFSDDGSVDYDTVLYDFGDGETDTNLNTSHIFTSAGDFEVKLTVTHTESGLEDQFTQTIHVYAYPVATITVSETNFPVCYGTEVLLTADAVGENYLWSNGAVTRSISVTEAGTYSVLISNSANSQCSVTSEEVSITYKAALDNTVTLQSWPLLLTANELEATYQWIDCTNGNIPISGATAVSYEPLTNGDYAVSITKNGCTVTSDCITISTVDLADYSIKELVKIYPNPARDILNIQSELQAKISCYNLTGIKIKEFQCDNSLQSLDISDLSSGLYLIKIVPLMGEWEGSTATYKLLKE